jgi:hypothetical protein
MPISIGNRYYSRSRVKLAARLFLENAGSSVVVPCDRLRFLSYLTHKGVSADQAQQKATNECMNIMRMLDNLGIPRIIDCQVIPMSVFYCDPALDLFVDALEKTIAKCRAASDRLESLTDFYLDRFYIATDRHAQSRTIQRSNVLNAAAFSIFVTEKLGYHKEIYKEESGLLQTYLYREHTDVLRDLLGKDHLDREFIALMPLLP